MKNTPSKIIKEMQQTAAVLVLDALYKLAPMNKKDFEKKVHLLYHGDPKNASSALYVKLMCEGRQQFTGLFDHETVIVTSNMQDEDGGGVPIEKLTINRLSTQNGGSTTFSTGLTSNFDLHLVLLSQKSIKSPVKISQEALYQQAHLSLRNGKKAWVVAVVTLTLVNYPLVKQRMTSTVMSWTRCG